MPDTLATTRTRIRMPDGVAIDTHQRYRVFRWRWRYALKRNRLMRITPRLYVNACQIVYIEQVR